MRLDGFTFSVIQGYSNWDDLSSSAQPLWNEFVKLAKTAPVGRIATRYTNVLDVPIGSDIDDYLTSGPRIPNHLPQTLSGFLQRVEVPFDNQITAAITQQLVPQGKVVLDIDVFKMDNIEGSSPLIWERLGRLREIKNLVFFSSITPKTLEMYK